MTFTGEFTYPLTIGKCYNFSGFVTRITGGQSLEVQLGDNTTFESLGTVTTVGGFSFQFTYDGTPEYTHVRLLFTGTPAVINYAINLMEQCSDTYCSECYKVTNCEPPHREHLLIEYTNNEDGLGFNYSGMSFNPNFYIVGGLRNADYTYDEEIFLNSGQERYPVYTAATKTKELWIHDMPEYMHDAMRLALVHDEFYIDGVKYVKLEGSYTPDWDTPNSLLAPCVIKLAEFDQNTVNDNC